MEVGAEVRTGQRKATESEALVRALCPAEGLRPEPMVPQLSVEKGGPGAWEEN